METQTKINNRLTEIFKTKSRDLLNIYFTAGYPQLSDTVDIIKNLQQAGVDIVEIGIPFSDPLADGPIIQRSSEIALENGMSMKVLFEQLKDIRKEVHVPLVLMGYINPVMQFGIERFCKKAAEAGIDGIILPDLPYDEYNERYKEIFENYNLSAIFLITPHTSQERLKTIDQGSEGFLYVVSTDSTTGSTKSILNAADYFNRIKNSQLRNPFMIGFNIHNRQSFIFATQYANGAIIGSAFIKMLSGSMDLEADIQAFVKNIIAD
jgi:tryptophan synthase alpha chain